MSRSKKDLLKKGALFVPLIYSFGATCEDLPLDVFLDDPTKISNSLRIINTFFDADGTVCCGNEQMLSESLRSSCSMADDSFMDPGVNVINLTARLIIHIILSLVDFVITLKFASWANRLSGGNEDSVYFLDQLHNDIPWSFKKQKQSIFGF